MKQIRYQAIAVDAFAIGWELEKASYYLLVPLFFSPATHACSFVYPNLKNEFPQQFWGKLIEKT